MLLFLGILMCSVSFISTTDPISSSGLAKTSYARGDAFGCSHKFFKAHCWKYCDGSSGKWCYTVDVTSRNCKIDYDCRYTEACQGWCAWNSQSGCSKACHEQSDDPAPQRPKCRRGEPYWMCQSSYEYADAWRSGIATGGKWISPDILNEHVKNSTANTILFNGNIVSTVNKNSNVPQSAVWYPMGQIRISSTTFYWTFTIRQIETPSLYIGISDLNNLAPGGVKGLFYGGNLTDGSSVLIENFGPTLKPGDKFSILVKLVDARIRMFVILNGKSLGLAFDVPENSLEGIYPVVKFHGEGSVDIEESVNAPTELEPVEPLILEGNWTLYALENDGTSRPKGPKAVIKITKTYDRVYDRAYRLRIQVLNKFLGTLIEKSTSNWVGEIIDSTVLQGTKAEMELETKISKHISGIKNIELDSVKNELRLVSLDSTSVWKQTEPKLKTVNWNPLYVAP